MVVVPVINWNRLGDNSRWTRVSTHLIHHSTSLCITPTTSIVDNTFTACPYGEFLDTNTRNSTAKDFSDAYVIHFPFAAHCVPSAPTLVLTALGHFMGILIAFNMDKFWYMLAAAIVDFAQESASETADDAMNWNKIELKPTVYLLLRIPFF